VKAIVLFGSPGSGKGTQAKMLVERLSIPHISTGDMLRNRIQAGKEAGTAVAATMQAGELVADELVNRIVEKRLAQPDAAAGFVLDGYPRTLAQAEHLSGWFDGRGVHEVVIHLVIDYNMVIARLTGRRECPQCGTLYNMQTKPPLRDGVCDLDGAKLVVRNDDSLSVIKGRLEAYEHQTRPVLDFYRSANRRLVEVDAGAGSPESVFERIWEALN
jgi:adenylate kinase